MAIPGRSGWLRCELGAGAQAGVVRGGAPGGGAAVGDGHARPESSAEAATIPAAPEI